MKIANRRLLVASLPVLLLAGCEDKPQDDQRTASGEVLEGSISDAMLPVDTATSQPPLLKSVPAASAEADEEGEEGDASAPAEPAPAE